MSCYREHTSFSHLCFNHIHVKHSSQSAHPAASPAASSILVSRSSAIPLKIPPYSTSAHARRCLQTGTSPPKVNPPKHHSPLPGLCSNLRSSIPSSLPSETDRFAGKAAKAKAGHEQLHASSRTSYSFKPAPSPNLPLAPSTPRELRQRHTTVSPRGVEG